VRSGYIVRRVVRRQTETGEVPNGRYGPAPGLEGTRSSRLGKLLFIASIVAYGVSLLMPAFEVLTGVPETTPGWLALLFGVFMISRVGSESLFTCFAWFANPFLLRAFLALWDDRPGAAFVPAGVSLVLGMSFMLVKETGISGGCNFNPIRLHTGYFLWFASMALALASGVVLSRKKETILLACDRKSLRKVVVRCAIYVVLGLSLPLGTWSVLC